MSDDEESELPLLPTARPKKRLLTEDDDDEMPPPSNTARLRRTQKDVSSIPETPQASQSARPSRAASVISEASTADTRSTAATRQPAIRVAASSRASTRAKQPIVLEDSDEDDTPVFASTTGRSRAGASGKTDSASAAEDVLGSALSKATKSTRATPATLGRRQVVVADDDDEMVRSTFRILRRLIHRYSRGPRSGECDEYNLHMPFCCSYTSRGFHSSYVRISKKKCHNGNCR